MRSDSRVALVTGAASGIGRAMVEAFRAREYVVVGFDVSGGELEVLARDTGAGVELVDVSDPVAVDDAIDRLLERRGRLDVLCNNAGIPDRFQGAAECPEEEWQRVLAVNLSGAFHTSRRALPAMISSGGGVIVNIASVAAFRGGEAGVAYTASKHGLIGLTRSIAAMYGDDGIRCLAICPGPVSTGITRLNARRRERGEMSERGEATARRTAAVRGRWLEPREIADIAVFAASDSASALNGCSIPAETGRMAF